MLTITRAASSSSQGRPVRTLPSDNIRPHIWVQFETWAQSWLLVSVKTTVRPWFHGWTWNTDKTESESSLNGAVRLYKLILALYKIEYRFCKIKVARLYTKICFSCLEQSLDSYTVDDAVNSAVIICINSRVHCAKLLHTRLWAGASHCKRLWPAALNIDLWSVHSLQQGYQDWARIRPFRGQFNLHCIRFFLVSQCPLELFKLSRRL